MVSPLKLEILIGLVLFVSCGLESGVCFQGHSSFHCGFLEPATVIELGSTGHVALLPLFTEKSFSKPGLEIDLLMPTLSSPVCDCQKPSIFVGHCLLTVR